MWCRQHEADQDGFSPRMDLTPHLYAKEYILHDNELWILLCQVGENDNADVKETGQFIPPLYEVFCVEAQNSAAVTKIEPISLCENSEPSSFHSNILSLLYRALFFLLHSSQAVDTLKHPNTDSDRKWTDLRNFPKFFCSVIFHNTNYTSGDSRTFTYSYLLFIKNINN